MQNLHPFYCLTLLMRFFVCLRLACKKTQMVKGVMGVYPSLSTNAAIDCP